MMQNPPARDETGMALIELLVALVVIALAVSIAGPAAINSLRDMTLRLSVGELASAMSTARSQAILSNQDAVVQIDSFQRRITANGWGRSHTLPRGIDVRIEVSDDERTTGGRARVRFHADGTSSGARITLRQSRQTALTTVDRLTGSLRTSWRRN